MNKTNNPRTGGTDWKIRKGNREENQKDKEKIQRKTDTKNKRETEIKRLKLIITKTK